MIAKLALFRVNPVKVLMPEHVEPGPGVGDMAETTQDLPPEVALIRQRREAGLNPISVRALERRVKDAGGDITEATIRNIEAGRSTGKPHHLAGIALALDITPDDLEATGRDNAIEAAQLLRDQQGPAVTPTGSAEVVDHLNRSIEEIRSAPGFTRKQRREMEEALIRHIDAVLTLHNDQLQILKPRSSS